MGCEVVLARGWKRGRSLVGWCPYPLESLGGLKAIIRCAKEGKAQEPLRFAEEVIVLPL